MIYSLLLVNASGGLMCYAEGEQGSRWMEEAGNIEIDKIIALASTIYTALEILIETGICKTEGKYKKLYLTYERASVTILRTASRLIFAVIHSKDMPRDKIEEIVNKAYKIYINTSLYNPLYTVEEQIDPSIFTEILQP